MDAVLDLKNVSKFYGTFKAVDNVTLTLPQGMIYGFLGPNGAGKTTTIRMILDIIKPSSGSICILGAPSALQVRNRIGYLPEEKGLYKKMKAWAIIAYLGSLKGLSRREARFRAYELLDRYGLKEFAEKRTDALSKGMAQKVQVLASIVHNPELVILDEPFSGLDPVNQQVMEQIIRELAGKGSTILFSTHVMQHAERLCEKIILMARGKKLFDGSIAEAKRKLPRRVQLQTHDLLSPLQHLPEIISMSPIEPKSATGDAPPSYDLEIRQDADPQRILQACFECQIRLHSFTQVEPSLHDVFVHLVGPEPESQARI